MKAIVYHIRRYDRWDAEHQETILRSIQESKSSAQGSRSTTTRNDSDDSSEDDISTKKKKKPSKVLKSESENESPKKDKVILVWNFQILHYSITL